jgi:hypothetical protein
VSGGVTAGRRRRRDFTALAERITEHLRATLTELSGIRAGVLAIVDVIEAEGRQPSRSDLGAIRDDLQTCLRRPNHPMDRIGVATALDYLTDAPYWMEWWAAESRGGLEYVSHSLNPQQDAFYEYTSRTWFVAAERSKTTAIIGPYVDFGGINSYSYTVTISVPLITARGFAGVVGADILAEQFEHFLVAVETRQKPVVLVNSDLRVIASNTSAFLPGDVLHGSEFVAGDGLDVGADVFHERATWRLLTPRG